MQNTHKGGQFSNHTYTENSISQSQKTHKINEATTILNPSFTHLASRFKLFHRPTSKPFSQITNSPNQQSKPHTNLTANHPTAVNSNASPPQHIRTEGKRRESFSNRTESTTPSHNQINLKPVQGPNRRRFRHEQHRKKSTINRSQFIHKYNRQQQLTQGTDRTRSCTKPQPLKRNQPFQHRRSYNSTGPVIQQHNRSTLHKEPKSESSKQARKERYCIKGAILEGGIPFNRAYGMPIYEYAGVNPRFNDIFNKAMGSITTIIMKRVLECYKGFEHINTIVDVGGGLGITLKLIISKHSHIHGVNFDLPHVIENAQTYPGITHVEGDMFESVPKGDAIFLKWILHNWNDDRCLKLLKNCYKATPNDGKVIALESILPVLPENTMISKLGSKEDFYMMTLQGGGKERAQNEFIELALGSGFSGIKFIGCFSGNWVMEFFK